LHPQKHIAQFTIEELFGEKEEKEEQRLCFTRSAPNPKFWKLPSIEDLQRAKKDFSRRLFAQNKLQLGLLELPYRQDDVR
jgi:hypothetical protein